MSLIERKFVQPDELIAFWVIFHVFCCLLIFFKINFLKKFLSGIPLECQTVWALIWPDYLSGPNCLPRLSADDTGRQKS